MSTDSFIAVIPARYASVRLPGKPLADIGGRPMIAWVHERALASGASEVVVATDDERVAEICARIGADVQLTAADHPSGSDRIAEVAAARGWPHNQIVVNVQGDEPLVPPALIAQVAALIANRPDAAIATLMTPIRSLEEWHDPNTAKVIVDRDGWALYFSRAAIPHARDGAGLPASAWRHIGLYAYRVGSLRLISAMPPCALEQIEKLEQLRALWLGRRIAVAEAVELPPRGVDTEDDLAAVRRILAAAER
jgi:3-deoxy-manno-octulosonate cytidylyltransferase (CMP-KDO synthetase)